MALGCVSPPAVVLAVAALVVLVVQCVADEVQPVVQPRYEATLKEGSLNYFDVDIKYYLYDVRQVEGGELVGCFGVPPPWAGGGPGGGRAGGMPDLQPWQKGSGLPMSATLAFTNAAGGPDIPTAVFLHGAKFASEYWLKSGTLQKVAESGVRALAIDLPGKGGFCRGRSRR